jgi:hypothetical protein
LHDQQGPDADRPTIAAHGEPAASIDRVIIMSPVSPKLLNVRNGRKQATRRIAPWSINSITPAQQHWIFTLILPPQP